MVFDKDLPGERWVPIPSDFFQGYEVSNMGRVRKPYKRNIYYKAEWLLVPTFKSGAKESLVRMINGVRKAVTLEKVVCAAFNGFPDFYQGDHLVEDLKLRVVVKEDKTKNKYFPDNISWVDPREKPQVPKPAPLKNISGFTIPIVVPVSTSFKTQWRPYPSTFS